MTIGGEPAPGRGPARHNLVSGRPATGPDHDAAMRIGGGAPGRRAHSEPRRGGHVPGRVAATSDRHRRSVTAARTGTETVSWPAPGERSRRRAEDDALRHRAGVVTSRHKAITSWTMLRRPRRTWC